MRRLACSVDGLVAVTQTYKTACCHAHLGLPILCPQFGICKLVVSGHQVELIMERGQRFESSEIRVATEPELFEMNRHAVAVCALLGPV
jgi:hypothetical protein